MGRTARRGGGIDRRLFLGATAAGLASGAWAQPPARPKVAALLTHFFFRSHAHVILENFLEPYYFCGEVVDPGFEVVSFYVDQVPTDDMSRKVAKDYGIRVFPSIAGALTLGGNKIAVDNVLLIGEHGQYPSTDRWQVKYPRKEFFDQIVAVVRAGGKPPAVFNDKHLSYRWDWAKEMVDTARQLKMPLMAGSSVPLAERRPMMEIPAGAKLTGAVSIHGGGVESYDIHCLEVLQSQVEARAGGETGVRAVQFLEGDALWQAAEKGDWSIPLAEAAMRAELGPDLPPFKELATSQRVGGSPPHGILVEYADGLKAIALKVGSSGIRWNFACQLEGDSLPLATSYYVGPWDNRNLFKALSHAIQAEFRDRRAPYPVERTLLTSGVLAAAMDSRYQKGARLSTPHLSVRYTPRDYRAMREMGQTWKIITPDTPEPRGMDSARLHPVKAK